MPRSELVQMAIDGVSILHPQNLRGRPPPADACEMLPSDSDMEYLRRRMTEAHQLASWLHADVRANTEAGVRKIKSLRLQVPHHSREPFVRGGVHRRAVCAPCLGRAGAATARQATCMRKTFACCLHHQQTSAKTT